MPARGAYLHGCPILDVILLSQLLAGEVHVLLPQPLALPTCFLKKKRREQALKDEKTQHTTESIRDWKNSHLFPQYIADSCLRMGLDISV